mgnify:FL=1
MKNYKRNDTSGEMTENKFNIEVEEKYLEKYYSNLFKNGGDDKQ